MLKHFSISTHKAKVPFVCLFLSFFNEVGESDKLEKRGGNMYSLFNKVIKGTDSSFVGPEMYIIWETHFWKIYKITNKNLSTKVTFISLIGTLFNLIKVT